jgi:hypothetical protein
MWWNVWGDDPAHLPDRCCIGMAQARKPGDEGFAGLQRNLDRQIHADNALLLDARRALGAGAVATAIAVLRVVPATVAM